MGVGALPGESAQPWAAGSDLALIPVSALGRQVGPLHCHQEHMSELKGCDHLSTLILKQADLLPMSREKKGYRQAPGCSISLKSCSLGDRLLQISAVLRLQWGSCYEVGPRADI